MSRSFGKVVSMGGEVVITTARGRSCTGSCCKNDQGARKIPKTYWDDDQLVLAELPDLVLQDLPFGRNDRDPNGFTTLSS